MTVVHPHGLEGGPHADGEIAEMSAVHLLVQSSLVWHSHVFPSSLLFDHHSLSWGLNSHMPVSCCRGSNIWVQSLFSEVSTMVGFQVCVKQVSCLKDAGKLGSSASGTSVSSSIRPTSSPGF